MRRHALDEEQPMQPDPAPRAEDVRPSTDAIRSAAPPLPVSPEPGDRSATAPRDGYAVPARPVVRATPLRVPATIAVAGLGANIVLVVVELLLGASEATGDLFLSVMVGVVVTHVLVVAGTAAAFITWMFLARRNLERWEIGGLGWRPGWAIGGWFVPLANLVIPKLVMDAIWSGSELTPSDGYAFKRSSGLIWAWWLPLILDRVITVVVPDEEVMLQAFLGTVLLCASAAAGIALVRRITSMQAERQAALDRSTPGYPAAYQYGA
jgi:hypothetical protein